MATSPSGFFDAGWYLSVNTDVAAAGIDPWLHYQEYGRTEGRWPAPPTAPGLESELWRGFAQRAEPALERLAAGPSQAERAWAAWALARWHASYGRWEATRRLMKVFTADDTGAALISHLGPLLLTITSYLKTGAIAEAARAVDEALEAHGPIPELLLAQVNVGHARGSAPSTLLAHLNRLFRDAGLAPLRLPLCAPMSLESLGRRARWRWPGRNRASGPCVSVIVPGFNSATVLPTALAGLAGQRWRNLEILIVDDDSTDTTREVAETWARRDPRIRVLTTGANQGAYVARNVGLAAACGDFITTHDADDWSHPEKISSQVAALQNNPRAMASVSHWVRATPAMEFMRWRMEEGWIHRNVSSLMIRAEVRETLGYWDRVRVNGDTEYYHRLKHACGSEAIIEVHPGVPLSFGRYDPGSLTQGGVTHARTQFHGLRRDYHEAALRWHERAPHSRALYLPQRPARRPFPVPAAIGVGDPEAELGGDDVVRRSVLFDAQWYLETYADVRAEGVDPALHYLEHGAREGRDPGPLFSTDAYRLAHLSDATNPLWHWETMGREQGLAALPEFPGRLREAGPCLMAFAHLAGANLFGAERSFLDVLDRLATHVAAPVVVVPTLNNGEYLEALRARSRMVHVLPCRWWREDVPPHPDTLSTIGDLIARHAPEAVHVNTLVLDAPLLAARERGIPTVVHVRELPAEDEALCAVLGADAETIRTRVLARADHLVANSPEVARWLDCPDRVTVQPNRVDQALFNLPFAPGTPPRVAMLSSNIAKKGIADFVAVAGLLAERGVAARCLLIGPETTDLRALYPLPENVETPGYAPDPVAAVAQADVVVSLSHFAESFGRTVLEAMAAGRPVVCYRRGMPQHLVVSGETGFVVPAGDIAAAAAAVARLVQSHELMSEMSGAARKRASDYK